MLFFDKSNISFTFLIQKELRMLSSIRSVLFGLLLALGLTTNTIYSTVREVETTRELDAILAEGKPVIIDISTVWCGACKMFKPTFEKLSNEYPNIIFVAVDGDNKNLQSFYQAIKITGYPTIVF